MEPLRLDFEQREKNSQSAGQELIGLSRLKPFGAGSALPSGDPRSTDHQTGKAAGANGALSGEPPVG